MQWVLEHIIPEYCNLEVKMCYLYISMRGDLFRSNDLQTTYNMYRFMPIHYKILGASYGHHQLACLSLILQI